MSFYTSLTGLNSATAQLAVTSNNIANVGTSGFKRSRADFGDIFSTSPLQKSSSHIGQGVSLKQVRQEFTQGNISTSGNSLDLAITGDGFFPLRTPDGLQDVYTRNGAFTLNDQNNVVNSTGQRLMAASVDSSGKANLAKLSVLTIPPKTSDEAVKTTGIQLGLNFPANAPVITEPFDRTNPETYNKSTALTVYDGVGNGYLATVYYARTQVATADNDSKWQTYFFVGDMQVKPALLQASNHVGEALYVNKYGELAPKTDPRVIPSSGTTALYTLDQLSNKKASTPATAFGSPVPQNEDGFIITATDTTAPGASESVLEAGSSVTFDIKLDGATRARTVEYVTVEEDKDPAILARNLEVTVNNLLGQPASDLTPDEVQELRYGVTVKFDTANSKFVIASGTTGDESSIEILKNDGTADWLGFNPPSEGQAQTNQLLESASPNEALRGIASLPAQLTGEVINASKSSSIALTSGNKDFLVSVDGITVPVSLGPVPASYTMDRIAEMLEQAINGYEDPESKRLVSGVQVAFENQRLVFTTATTGEGASIQVTGKSDWGLANTEMKFGQTTEWVKLTQLLENGAPQYVKNGVQTEDGSSASAQTEWWPVYLDRGELSFDMSGKPVSPLQTMPFETAILQGGTGALTMSIDFTKSTQYPSAFAVLSQSQDGAPEGELMGLNIEVDGLVNATYSNGSQVSLGKIVLANFSSPSGLRQVGDSSYLASATSGMATIGEAGSAGFGSIRAGATERSNVDLTQELVDLITAQRYFQANAKAIETSSTMTSAIINIRS
jgi:flagellar hook protein FlgE